VRANSILRKAAAKLAAAQPPRHSLEPSEVELIDLIARFPDAVQQAASEHKTLHITNLAYETAKAFNDFYNQCPVLQAEEPQRSFRLGLVAAAKQTLANALALLGILAPEVM
jgi:arginyl-tRNA synthetase